MKKTLSRAALLAVLAAIALPVPADPPPWAPAHGWRKKNDPNYVGYTGKKWDKDYGVVDGKCNSAQVGAVLGGVAGGVIGSQVVKDENRPVAIVVGTVLGAVIGSQIGAEIDNGDRGCMGHAFELAGEQKTVVWTNAATGVTYRLTPTRNFGDQRNPCREFTALVSKDEGKKQKKKHKEKHGEHGDRGERGEDHDGKPIKGVACRQGAGDWQIKI